MRFVRPLMLAAISLLALALASCSSNSGSNSAPPPSSQDTVLALAFNSGGKLIASPSVILPATSTNTVLVAVTSLHVPATANGAHCSSETVTLSPKQVSAPAIQVPIITLSSVENCRRYEGSARMQLPDGTYDITLGGSLAGTITVSRPLKPSGTPTPSPASKVTPTSR